MIHGAGGHNWVLGGDQGESQQQRGSVRQRGRSRRRHQGEAGRVWQKDKTKKKKRGGSEARRQSETRKGGGPGISRVPGEKSDGNGNNCCVLLASLENTQGRVLGGHDGFTVWSVVPTQENVQYRPPRGRPVPPAA
eukprot:381397-Prorocentrum_minimum.AAC.2